jgi:hypothetical protein
MAKSVSDRWRGARLTRRDLSGRRTQHVAKLDSRFVVQTTSKVSVNTLPRLSAARESKGAMLRTCGALVRGKNATHLAVTSAMHRKCPPNDYGSFAFERARLTVTIRGQTRVRNKRRQHEDLVIASGGRSVHVSRRR